MKVVSMMDRLNQKKEHEEFEEAKEYMLYLLRNMTRSEQMQLHEAVMNEDQETYRKLTEPIIRRKCMIEYNDYLKEAGE